VFELESNSVVFLSSEIRGWLSDVAYTPYVFVRVYTYICCPFFLVGCASSIWSYLRIRVDNAGTYSLPKLMLADPTCGDVGLFVVAE